MQTLFLQPSRVLGDYMVSPGGYSGDEDGSKGWSTSVMKHIETGQCHLSAGYIFALRVSADLPHNRALLPSVALLLY